MRLLVIGLDSMPADLLSMKDELPNIGRMMSIIAVLRVSFIRSSIQCNMLVVEILVLLVLLVISLN